MTMTQIASMNPIERTASIYSLPAEIFCSRLGSLYDEPSARTIPIEPIRDGHSPRCRSGEEEVLSKIEGVEHRKSNDHRSKPDTQHVAHIMSGHALARFLGRHDGALLALQVPLSEFGAVLRRAHGHSPTLCS